MSKWLRLTVGAAAAACLAVVLVACDLASGGEPTPVLASIEQDSAPGASAGASSLPLPQFAAVVPGPSSPGLAPFSVLAREPHLARAPCANCHTVALTDMRWDGSDGRATAHWQTELAHASEAVMTCTTCHAPDDLDQLRMLTSRPVAFNDAYEVCGQCHAPERADWEGGAHGKRVGGWAPPRVIYNCTECHDPHRPAFDTRWPARAGRTDP